MYSQNDNHVGQEVQLEQWLHVCTSCGGELVYPVDWSEERPGFWRIELRCCASQRR